MRLETGRSAIDESYELQQDNGDEKLLTKLCQLRRGKSQNRNAVEIKLCPDGQ